MKHVLYHADVASLTRDEQLAALKEGLPLKDAKLLEIALDYAREALIKDEKVRPRGLDVAFILKPLDVDWLTLTAALLSDPYLRETFENAAMQEQFGAGVAKLVGKVNWLNTFKGEMNDEANEPEQTELLRQMLMAVVNDVRAVLVKLAYRVQRLRLLGAHSAENALAICQETLDIFAPLANRLGVSQLKWELEDLSFRHLNPTEYRRIAKSLTANRRERELYLNDFSAELRRTLADFGVTAKVYGRPKHIFSIWRKLQRKHLDVDELYDLLAVRVVVDSVAACYTVLGLIHGHWTHVPREFDDYITNPKPNGYQSLHTVVIGPKAHPVEIQIRTEEMHRFAELGVAAHWRYKEGGKRDYAYEQNIAALRSLLDARDNDQNLLDDFQSETLSDHIFVLTPKGQIVRLPRGATPVDFAYQIHTEVGHRCRGAKVNGHIVPLTYRLDSGEQVEILTAKTGGPTLGWLEPKMGYIFTNNAREKVRQWFKQQDHDRLIRAGKAIVDKERHKLNLKEADLSELAEQFRVRSVDDLLLAVGRGEITPSQLAHALHIPEIDEARVVRPVARRSPVEPGSSDQGIIVHGVKNILTQIASCCAPVPGDAVVGYVTTRGGGVTVHRTDCHNLRNLSPKRQLRLIEVSWDEAARWYPVDIEVKAQDRKGLLKDVSQVLTGEQINIVRTQTQTAPEDLAVGMRITVEVNDSAQLSVALDKLLQVPNVLEARRARRSVV